MNDGCQPLRSIDPHCGGVKAMKDRAMDVLRHDIADVADLEIYDGPDTDILGTQTVVTVVCGEVTGELDRVV
jgi:hypothetical protein